MNKLLLAFGGLFFSTYCAAQTNTFPSTGHVGIRTSNPAFPLDVQGVIQLFNKDNDFATWDNLRIWAGGSNSFIESNGDEDGLIIRSNGGAKILLMNNVGIGTLNPTDALSVNGRVRAKEVKVEMANWPDYVFGKAYELPPLSEIAKHIREKGHLPGIPSAKEVKVNGIDLGEMNKKLLEKIEELTLHLIRQEKKQSEMEEEIKQLKSTRK